MTTEQTDGLPLFQVDAFTDRPFSGNPAAVCLLSEPASDEWMQAVAAEMNLAETAFLQQQEDGFGLRWFTPVVEVDLCGHATLASAHVLWESGVLETHRTARFHTRSGLLTAEIHGDWIELDFPADPPEACDPHPDLAQALGARPTWIGRGRFDYLVEVDGEDDLRSLQPDMALLATIPARGVVVTSRSSTTGYDFVSRFFGPASGIPEDPVTGSSHCALACYWSPKLGKDEMSGWQASKRGGTVRVKLSGDRVKLSGQAVTVLTGQLLG